MPTRDWGMLFSWLHQHLMRNQSLWVLGGVWSQGWNLKMWNGYIWTLASLFFWKKIQKSHSQIIFFIFPLGFQSIHLFLWVLVMRIREKETERQRCLSSLSLSLSPYFIATSSNCGNLLKLYGTKMCTMKIDIHSNNPGDVTMDNPQPMSKGWKYLWLQFTD